MSEKIVTLTPSIFMGGNLNGFNFSAGIVSGLYLEQLSKHIDKGSIMGELGLAPWAGASFDFYELKGGVQNHKLSGVGGLHAFYLSKGWEWGVGWANGISVGANLDQSKPEVGFRSYLNAGNIMFGLGPALVIQNFKDPLKTMFLGLQLHVHFPVYGLEF